MKVMLAIAASLVFAVNALAQPVWYTVPQKDIAVWSSGITALNGGSLRYTGISPITAMIPYRGGVLTAFASIKGQVGQYAAFWSVDGKVLNQGKPRYSGISPITAMTPYHGGVLTAFTNVVVNGIANQNAVYWSPDGKVLNLEQNRVYSGVSPVTAIIAYRGGVLTAFANVGGIATQDAVFWSPDGKVLNKNEVYSGVSPVTAMTPYRGGVITAFTNVHGVSTSNAAYWSPDGKVLNADPPRYTGVSPITAITPYQNGLLTAFANVGAIQNQHRAIWSQEPKKLNDGPTRYDGISPVVALVPLKSGVVTAFAFVVEVRSSVTTGVRQPDGRIELGWMNLTPCVKVQFVNTSIPGLSLPTLYTGEQRLRVFAQIDAIKVSPDAVRDCAAASAGGCLVAAVATSPAGCAPAFQATLTACLKTKAAKAIVDSVQISAETECRW